MKHRIGRPLRAMAAVAAVSLALVACSGDDDSVLTESGDEVSGELDALRVPQDHDTIQAAVDAAAEGDLVLVDEGVYNEAVDVTTADVTIRGVDRNKVILDGEFEAENGIRVLDTEGVVVENMTARNYVANGFFWTGSDRYRGSYLTTYRTGDYGVYAFDSVHGKIDNSYASGNPDAGFYIGQCYECDAVIDNVVSEYNGLGYSGTNSGGELYIINSTFRNNRAGIVPNSGSYELCYPGRENTIVANTVHDNNYMEGPGIDVSLLAQGNGILVAGGVENRIERNRVYNHDRAGIGMVPFPEEDASDTQPPEDEWDQPCSENRDRELPEESPGTVLWNARQNEVLDNVVEDSGMADIASATIPDPEAGITVEGLNNCFSGNQVSSSAPENLQELAPCGDQEGSGGDFSEGALDLVSLIADQPEAPPEGTYKSTPVPEDKDNMPDALSAPAERFEGPETPDVAVLTVPEKLSGS